MAALMAALGLIAQNPLKVGRQESKVPTSSETLNTLKTETNTFYIQNKRQSCHIPTS